MVKIVDSNKMTRATPSGVQGIVTPDVSMVGKGAMSIGKGAIGLSGSLHERDLIKRENIFADEKLNMAIWMSKYEREAVDDPDYETVVERSSVEMENQLGIAAANIRNPNDRHDFIGMQRLAIEKSKGRIAASAQDKRRDRNRGVIDTQLADSVGAALFGNMGEVSSLVKERLDGAVNDGTLRADEAAANYRDWQTEAAVAKLAMMPDEEQAEALKMPWAKNLPPLTYAKITKANEANLVAGKADVNVASYGDITLNEGLAKAGEIKDQDVRDETKKRWKLEVVANKADKLAVNNASMIDMMNDHDQNETHYDDIKKKFAEEWAELPAGHRQQIENYTTGAKRTVSSPAALEAVGQLVRNKEWNAVLALVDANFDSFSSADRKRFIKEAENKSAPETTTVLQAIKGVMPEAKPPVHSEMLLLITGWQNDYKDANGGKAPSQREVEDEVKHRVMLYDATPFKLRDPTSWFGGEKELYKHDEVEQELVLDEIYIDDLRESDPAMYQRLLKRTNDVGRLDRFEVMSLQREWNDADAYLDGLKDSDPVLHAKMVNLIEQRGDLTKLQMMTIKLKLGAANARK